MPLDVLVSGRIATFAGPAGFGWVEAVGIRQGRVAFAGSAIDLETRADPHTMRIELEPGEIAMPGLTDAHLHLLDAAVATEHVDLTRAQAIDDGLAMIADAALALPPGAWLEGGGWDQRRWGRWPTAADLDRVIPGRPAAIWSFDHHAIWGSSASFLQAGVDARSVDPAGGIIRRLDDGSPEGVVLENACVLVMSCVPPPDQQTLNRTLLRIGRQLAELGVTGVHDPGNVSPDVDLIALDAYARLADAGELPLRVHASIRPESLDRAIERGLRSGALLGEDPNGRARIGWLKLFADGTLGSQTAALLQPREGSTDVGVFRQGPEELATFVRRAAEAGIASQIHAIGDAAVRAALDALVPVAASMALMPRLEHVQLVNPADRHRFARHGVAASVQPVHLREDAESARHDWGARAEQSGYAWNTLVAAGAVLAFGTDAPVEPIDPWPGIALSVLRRDPSWGPDAIPFGAHEALDLEQALRAATLGPAQTTREADRGRLTPGARADLIVLPAAPREPNGIGASFAAVRPRLVLIDGDVVVDV
ncbi:MAG: amidohydrolase [Chloroflexi bacterium]|nr:amidohydrolase [Chloroflexota bacterium]